MLNLLEVERTLNSVSREFLVLGFIDSGDWSPRKFVVLAWTFSTKNLSYCCVRKILPAAWPGEKSWRTTASWMWRSTAWRSAIFSLAPGRGDWGARAKPHGIESHRHRAANSENPKLGCPWPDRPDAPKKSHESLDASRRAPLPFNSAL